MAAIICAILSVPTPIIGFLVSSSYVLMWNVVNRFERYERESHIQTRFDDIWAHFHNKDRMSK